MGGVQFTDTKAFGEEEAAHRADQDQRAASNGHGKATPDLLAGLRDGTWLDQQVFPPLTYAVPGVIPEGSVLLVGPPKIGKSWFVLTVALAAAAGGRALGIKVEQRPVLYLALEDGDRRLQDRCRKLLRGDSIPAGFQYLTRILPGQPVEAVVGAWLERQHDAPPLVILDTLGKVMPSAGPGESAYQRDYRVGSTLKQLADERAGITMLTNHHDRKANSEDFIDSVLGTHGLAGAADTIIALARARAEEAGSLKVTGRDVPEGEYAVRFDEGYPWRLDGADLDEAARRARDAKVTADLGDRSAEVVGYVLKHPEGITPAKVAAALGIDPKAASVYLTRAVQAERLRKLGRGLYTPVETVESVESGRRPGRIQRSQHFQHPFWGQRAAVRPRTGVGAGRPGEVHPMTRETAAAKARRYLAEGRLTVLEVGPSIVRAVCRGDGQVYRSAGGAGSGAAPARLPAPSAPTAPTYSRSAWSSSNPAAPTA